MKALATAFVAVIASLNAIAAGYDPLPSTWGARVNLPGLLSVGAMYCTYDGKCKTVGDEITSFRMNGYPVGGVQACQDMPEHALCLNARVPVQIISDGTGNGPVIVRFNGTNYAVAGANWSKREPDGSFIGGPISVLDHGTAIPLQLYKRAPIPGTLDHAPQPARS